MIKKQYLFPQCYINKIPCCDECKQALNRTGFKLMSSPPLIEYVCPNCQKKYSFREEEVKGEWKWRTI